jgi:hypothetical protein
MTMMEEKLKRMFDFDVLGVPPLKMVLVPTGDQSTAELLKPVGLQPVTEKPMLRKQEIVIRLIVSLQDD